VGVFLAACVSAPAPDIVPKPEKSSVAVPTSGKFFGSNELRLLQEDVAQNPGYLWVDNGKQLFAEDCARCHAADTTPALALSRPRASADGARAENLNDAINTCVTRRVQKPAHEPEGQTMLSLTAYLMHSAMGKFRSPMDDHTQTSAAMHEGRALWHARVGKQDLSCSLCHDGMAGMRLLNQNISQGHSVGYPTYRVEWQTLGSVERRIRACYFGMQAPVPAAGAAELRALELYMAQRSAPLPIEAPAVRR
jgi:sulfur-oxidizing protein SoxA